MRRHRIKNKKIIGWLLLADTIWLVVLLWRQLYGLRVVFLMPELIH